jgi:hypothetical protein
LLLEFFRFNAFERILFSKLLSGMSENEILKKVDVEKIDWFKVAKIVKMLFENCLFKKHDFWCF